MLDRFDVIDETIGLADGSVRVRKLVNNLNANYTPNSYTQWSFQYGAKYVFDRLDGASYTGYTDLLGVEVRRDLGQELGHRPERRRAAFVEQPGVRTTAPAHRSATD